MRRGLLCSLLLAAYGIPMSGDSTSSRTMDQTDKQRQLCLIGKSLEALPVSPVAYESCPPVSGSFCDCRVELAPRRRHILRSSADSVRMQGVSRYISECPRKREKMRGRQCQLTGRMGRLRFECASTYHFSRSTLQTSTSSRKLCPTTTG